MKSKITLGHLSQIPESTVLDTHKKGNYIFRRRRTKDGKRFDTYEINKTDLKRLISLKESTKSEKLFKRDVILNKLKSIDPCKYTASCIAKELQVAVQYVNSIAKQHNIKLKSHKEIAYENINSLPIEEMVLNEIIYRSGYGREVVRKVLKFLKRKPVKINKKYKKLGLEAENDAVRLSVKEFTEKYKCDESIYYAHKNIAYR